MLIYGAGLRDGRPYFFRRQRQVRWQCVQPRTLSSGHDFGASSALTIAASVAWTARKKSGLVR